MSSLKDLASLIMVPSLYKDGELHTVKPLADEDVILHPDATGNHDGNDGTTDRNAANFTFSRGSNLAATRVDVNGLIEKGRENLALQGSDISTQSGSWFVNQGGVTIQNATTSPIGTNTASQITANGSNTYSGVRDAGIAMGALRYTYSVYLKAQSGTPDIRLTCYDGVTFHQQDFSITTDWERYSITFTPTAGTHNIYITSTQAVSWYAWGAQFELGLVATDYIETGASTAQAGILEDMPRLDYSGSCPALLLEPQRSNLILHSEYTDGANWSNEGSIVDEENTSETISPEGVYNAVKLVSANSTSEQWIQATGISVTTGNDCTISCFVKKSDYDYFHIRFTGIGGAFSAGSIWFNIANGTLGTAQTGITGTIENYGNGWYRISATKEVTGTTANAGVRFQLASSDNNTSVVGDGSKGTYIYGCQAELGSYPTSYIPTYGSSVTRSLDSCLATSVGDLIGQEQGTLFVEFTIDNDTITGANRIFSATDGTINNRILLLSNSAESMRFYLASGGSVIFDQNYSSILNGPHKVALGYSGTNLVGYMDGVKLFETNSSYNIPATTNLYLGTIETGSSGAGMEGTAKQAAVFKTRLTNAELAALTTI